MSANDKALQEKRLKKLQRDAQELISLLKHIDPENMEDKEAVEKAQGLLLNMALQGDFNTNLEAFILAGLNKDDLERLNILLEHSQKIFAVHELRFKSLSLAIMAAVNPQIKEIALEAQLEVASIEKLPRLLNPINPENMEDIDAPQDKEIVKKAQNLLLNMVFGENINPNLKEFILAEFNRDDLKRLKILLNRLSEISKIMAEEGQENDFTHLLLTISSIFKPEITKLKLDAAAALDAAEALDAAVAAGKTSAIPAFAQSGIKATVTIATAVDSEGKTALHHAAEQGDLKAINWLLKAGYHFAMIKDKTGQTALDYLAAAGKTSAIPVFAKSGIEATATIATAIDSEGKTALHHAVEQGNSEAVHWLIKVSYRFAMMKDRTGRTPLDYAAETDNYKIFFAIYARLEQSTYKKEAEESLKNAGPTIIMMESRRRLNAKYNEFTNKYTRESQQLPEEINKLFVSCIELISAVEKNAARHEQLISLCLKLSAKTDRTDDEQLLFDGLLSALKVSAMDDSRLKESQDYQYLINRGFVIEKCNQKDIDVYTKKTWADLDVAMSAFDDCLISENMSVQERQEAYKAANERLAVICPVSVNSQASAKQDGFQAKIEEKSNKKTNAALQMIRGAVMFAFGLLSAPILFLSIPLLVYGRQLFKESKKQYNEACNAEAIKKPFENLSRSMPQDLSHAAPQNEIAGGNKELPYLSSEQLKALIKIKVRNIVNKTILKKVIELEKSKLVDQSDPFAVLRSERIHVDNIKHRKFIANRLTEKYFQNLLGRKQGLPSVAEYKWLFEKNITASKYPQCKNDIEELYHLLDVLLEQEKANLLLPKDQVPVQEKHEIVVKQDIPNPVEPCKSIPLTTDKKAVTPRHSTDDDASSDDEELSNFSPMPSPPKRREPYVFRLPPELSNALEEPKKDVSSRPSPSKSHGGRYAFLRSPEFRTNSSCAGSVQNTNSTGYSHRPSSVTL